MAVAPKFINFNQLATSASNSSLVAVNNVDMFVDFVCPYSKKLYLKWEKEVIPAIAEKYPGKFLFNLKLVPQPWHHSSQFAAESLLAVNKLKPAESLKYAKVLFEHQTDFFETAVVNLTRNQIYERLSKLAAETIDVDPKEVYDLLYIRQKKDSELEYYNLENKVTMDLKYFVKVHRQLSVHVTPTIVINGVFAKQIESSTSAADVIKMLEECL